MSKFGSAIMYTPVVVMTVIVVRVTLGRVIDESGSAFASLSTVGTHPEWSTPILDMFSQFHWVTVVVLGAWFAYVALCAVWDAMYSRRGGL